jgi:hypothetical protein
MKQAIVRRYLRLKEWQANSDQLMRPSSDYLSASDGSLRNIEYRLRTDADGYILPPPSEIDSATDSIIFFGDSFVESTFVPEEQRFFASVQTILGNAGRPARCMNAGYSGATTLHLLMSLIGKVGRRPATTIVLIFPSNDAFSLVKQGGYWCRSDKRYSPIVPVLDGLDQSLQPLDTQDERAVLNLFVDACNRLGLPLILATFPHRSANFSEDSWLKRRFKNTKNYERAHDWRRSVNAVGRAIATRRNIPFIDLEELVSTRTECFYDDLHMNEVGSAIVAQVLSEYLLSLHIIAKKNMIFE